MASQEHISIIMEGRLAWNAWREKHSNELPDLSGMDLSKQDLKGINLSGADLNGANLSGINLSHSFMMGAKLMGADLSDANLQKADFMGAVLIGCRLHNVDLSGAKLNLADLSWADLSKSKLVKANLMGATLAASDLSDADLQGADLTAVRLLKTNFENANLSGCTIYGISSWGLNLNGTNQTNLIITPRDEPLVMINQIEVAQFVYLILNNKMIHNSVKGVVSNFVLLLCQYSEERRAFINELSQKLTDAGYIPILCDVKESPKFDLKMTLFTLSRLSKFCIFDIADPDLVPQAALDSFPLTEVPILFLLSSSNPVKNFSLLLKESAKLDLFQFSSKETLLGNFLEKVIHPLEEKAKKFNIQELINLF